MKPTAPLPETFHDGTRFPRRSHARSFARPARRLRGLQRASRSHLRQLARPPSNGFPIRRRCYEPPSAVDRRRWLNRRQDGISSFGGVAGRRQLPRPEVEHKGQRHLIDFNRAALNAIHAKLIDWGIAPDAFAWPPRHNPKALPYPGLDRSAIADYRKALSVRIDEPTKKQIERAL